jgi:hypothetical protein
MADFEQILGLSFRRRTFAAFIFISATVITMQAADHGSSSDAIATQGSSAGDAPTKILPGQTNPKPQVHAPSGPGSSSDALKTDSRSTPQPATVKGLVEDFKTTREQALKHSDSMRKELNNKLRFASAEERSRLISEFREKQNIWLQEQKAVAEEFRQRAKTIREEFKNRERDQLLDDIKGKTQETRERIGKD